MENVKAHFREIPEISFSDEKCVLEHLTLLKEFHERGTTVLGSHFHFNPNFFLTEALTLNII